MIRSAQDLSRSGCFLDDGRMADWQRLGKAVIARRVDLGYKRRDDFAEVLGFSSRVLGDIETGRRSNYDPTTVATLERALRWETGSVDRILAGSEAGVKWPRVNPGDTVTLANVDAGLGRDEIDLIYQSTTMSAREKLLRIGQVLELRAQVEAESRAQQEAPVSEDTGASATCD